MKAGPDRIEICMIIWTWIWGFVYDWGSAGDQ